MASGKIFIVFIIIIISITGCLYEPKGPFIYSKRNAELVSLAEAESSGHCFYEKLKTDSWWSTQAYVYSCWKNGTETTIYFAPNKSLLKDFMEEE